MSQILKLILVGIFNTMFDLKSVFVFLVLKIHVLLYFSYIVGISVCLKNLDFGPELTFDPEHFCMSKFDCPGAFMALGPNFTLKVHEGTSNSKEKC